MTKQYFDNLEIRNRVEVTIGKYTAYSYEDNMFGDLWFGNVNIYKNDRPILHATKDKAFTEEELKEYLKMFIEKEQELYKICEEAERKQYDK